MAYTTHITYLFDPLCGWCYGASPGLEKLALTPTVALTVAPTGLFADENARALDANFAAYAWANDQRIASLTGQPFSNDYRLKVLGDHTRLFDSGPATRALTAVHLTAPGREFEALKAIQRARYVDGRNNADVTVLVEILRGLDLEAAASRLLSPDTDLLAAYARRLEAARAQMGPFALEGVPALLVGEGQACHVVRGSPLYGGLNVLKAAVGLP